MPRPGRWLTTVLLLAACTGAPPDGWSRISSEAFAQELAAVPASPRVIVDVREPELFQRGHIPGAINVPWPDAKTRAPAELDTGADIVLVCHGGPMGDELAEILAQRGFAKVRNLEGGMNGWRGPVVAGS